MTREMIAGRRPGARGTACGLAFMLVCGLCSAAPVSAGTSAPDSPPNPASPVLFKLEARSSSSHSNLRGNKTRLHFYLKVQVRGEGAEAMTITGIGRSGAGLKLLTPVARGPYVLQPGKIVSFGLRYEITDCGDVQKGEWPVPVHVRSDEGDTLVYAPLQLFNVGTRGPVNLPWQTALANQVCPS
ncbi:hypothetical protein [Streptosporangium roseum]|uniref:hypothetical protein n=1 Tax=Streptosporangium roseum TaxID=2001 RepID=UPI0033274091